MIYWGILASIFIIGYILINKKLDHELFWVLGIVILITSSICMSLLPLESKTYEKESVNIEILSIERNSSLSGSYSSSFFLGSGSIDTQIKYFWYEDRSKGLLLRNAFANDCYIIESDKVKPIATYINTYSTYNIETMELWSPYPVLHYIFTLGNKYIPTRTYRCTEVESITVPTNTVLKEFKL